MDSNELRQDILALNLSIAENQVFLTGDKDVTRKILQQTSGRGADVVLSCSEHQRSHDYWKCLAPFGRVIDTSGDEGTDLPCISLSNLPRGTTFASFYLELLGQTSPAAVSRYEKFNHACSEILFLREIV